MTDNNDFFAEGYHFGSREDAEQARTEKKKAEYFEERLNGKNTKNILAVYDKILDERIFETPVGWEYVKQLQQELRQLGVPEERIRPIPLYVTFAHKEQSTMEALVRERVKPSRKISPDRKKLRTSVIVNIFLGVLVVAMFVITLKSDNPNILNYKKAIVNQYAAWEQELTEREKLVRQKETELGLEWKADEDIYEEK
ncbi:MAG: hypothetical protein ACI4EP_00600 [Suilimivivens sp.]